MSNFNDDEFYEEQDSAGQEFPEGSTRPNPPYQQPAPQGDRPTGSRRPIPADDIPPVYARPPLSRRQEVQPQPLQDRIKRQTGTFYGSDPDQNASVQFGPPAVPPRTKRNADRRERTARQPRPAQDRSRSGLYLPWWSLVLLIAFVGCAALGALAIVSSLEGGIPADSQTPVVIVITSTYTVGPPASETPLPQAPTLTATKPLPTIPATLTLPPGDFAIGEPVVVVGVSDSGLNVRSSPGVDSTVKFRAQEGEVYVLKDGPQSASNDEWWYIQDRIDQNKGGWASRRYLTVQSGANAPAATTVSPAP